MDVSRVAEERLKRSFGLLEELVRVVPEGAFGQRLPGIRSNTLGLQLWCVVGARESYARGIEAGDWQGFACSLAGDDCVRRDALLTALESSGQQLLGAFPVDAWSEKQLALAFDAVEHEAAHQGQLIRYLYGLELPIPQGWKDRYALS